MKEKVKRAGILTFVFLIAVIVFSFLTNQGNADMTADMGGATLPRIQIVSGEYEINPLVGYVSEMNVGKIVHSGLTFSNQHKFLYLPLHIWQHYYKYFQ